MASPQVDLLHTLAGLTSGQVAATAIGGPDAQRESLWRDLVHAAAAHGLGPLLLWRLQQQGIRPADYAVLAPLAEERTRTAVHYMLATAAQAQMQAALESAGIPCIWLKGIVLAQSVYPSPELRPMADVDALVPYAQRQEALAVAQQLGYAQESPQLFDGREGLKHHYHLASRTLRPLKLELHFRLLGDFDRILTVEDLSWFWHHRIEIERDGRQFYALRPEAHLLYLCGHAVLQHGEADLRLLRYYDLHALIAQTPSMDWGLLVQGAVRLRWTYAVERALRLAQSYFATPLPEDLLSELTAGRPAGEEVAHVTRRQTRRTTSEIVAHDLAAMGWHDRMRTVIRIVAPPPDYMRTRYGLAGAADLPAAYLRRWRHMANDIMVSLRRRLRRYS